METNRQHFLRKMNEAFANNDVAFILDAVTEDIHWTIVGDKMIRGKDQFAHSLQEMAPPGPMKMEIRHVITHGKEAVVEGNMVTPDGRTYAFCDIYTFNGFKKNLIKEIKSYVLEVLPS